MNDLKESVKRHLILLPKTLMRFTVKLMMASVVASARTAKREGRKQVNEESQLKMDSPHSVWKAVERGEL